MSKLTRLQCLSWRSARAAGPAFRVNRRRRHLRSKAKHQLPQCESSYPFGVRVDAGRRQNRGRCNGDSRSRSRSWGARRKACDKSLGGPDHLYGCATYLVFARRLELMNGNAMSGAPAESLAIKGQPDGVGVWGRWNANGPAVACLFNELKLGRSLHPLMWLGQVTS